MKRLSYRTSQFAILGVGGMLALYLVAVIGLAYLGQIQLRAALTEHEKLIVEKQATAVSYFVNELLDTVEEISNGRPIHTFLSNRDLGMSMRYGLRSSLTAINGEFTALISRKRAHGEPVFRRIYLVDDSGNVLVDAGIEGQTDGAEPSPPRAGLSPSRLHHDPATGTVLVSAPITFKGRSEGYVSAEVDTLRALRPFMAESSGSSGKGSATLVDPEGHVILSTATAGDTENGATGHGQHAQVRIPVADTGWQIVRRIDPSIYQGVITSPAFLAALATIGLPLFAGMVFLWRMNIHNLLLEERISAASRRKILLREQNDSLQREINRRVASEKQLAHKANFDDLTGLPNRQLALDRLDQAIKQASRDGRGVLIMFLDLDRFKQVNDSLGHAAGDELLREASRRLRSLVRESDTVSRLGGDEFLVIYQHVALQQDSRGLAQNMLRALSAPFYVQDHEFFVGASVGVATYPEAGSEPDILLKNADIAMYAAKEKGRNRICVFDPSMDALTTASLRLETNLRHALERNEFRLEFQPIVDLSSGRPVAMEALLRWDNPELGAVPPDRFISTAEETGVIHELGEWVLREACRIASEVQIDDDFRVAVNLSSKQFSRPKRLLDCVLHALRSSGLMPHQLEIEITESILIDDRAETTDLLNQLDRIGVRLSIDDFGTGYSALNYLQRFPFDVLKIDRGFTSGIPDSSANTSLIRAIIAMAHALELEVIAEGIESREQAGFLLIHNCELGQGYLYSRPMSAEHIRNYLQQDLAASA